ncbi:glycoside hydrolase family 68 protein, partial [Pseudomonas aeruginosa]|nr:glycoside hydrolase family 68 protein [Pseudomonas aeruginosa]
ARANATDLDAATLREGRLLPQSGSGFPGTGVSFEQRLVTASGPTARGGGGRVVFDGEWQHRVVVRADGTRYQTLAQADVGPLYGFRDPWVFRDPGDGRLYMLFTANVGGTQSQQRCGPEDLGDPGFRAGLGELSPEAPWYNGAVGLAVADGENLNSWTLLAPLLTASC